jgi:hypothetical protein
MNTLCALSGKNESIPRFPTHFSQDFFIEFLTSFFDSEPSGTIFVESGVLWTVQFFKNFHTPYFRPGLKTITGLFRIGDLILWQDSFMFYQE